jgi:hypothetical protein
VAAAFVVAGTVFCDFRNRADAQSPEDWLDAHNLEDRAAGQTSRDPANAQSSGDQAKAPSPQDRAGVQRSPDPSLLLFGGTDVSHYGAFLQGGLLWSPAGLDANGFTGIRQQTHPTDSDY